MRTFFWLVVLISFSSSADITSKQFFSKPEISSLALSPNGKYLATLNDSDLQQKLLVTDTASGKKVELYKILAKGKKETRIGAFQWLGNKYLAVETTSSKQGINELIDTKRKSDYLIFDLESDIESILTYKIKSRGRIVNPLISDDEYFLFSKPGATSRIYKIRVSKLNMLGKRLAKLERPDGGQMNGKNQLVAIKGVALHWFFALNGEVDSVLYFNRGGKLALSNIENRKLAEEINVWTSYEPLKKKSRRERIKERQEKLKRKRKGRTGHEPETTIDDAEYLSSDRYKYIIPILKASGENRYYAFDFKGQINNEVFLVDYNKASLKSVYKTHAYKILSINKSDDGLLSSVNLIKDGGVQTDYLDEKGNSLAVTDSDELEVSLTKTSDGKTELRYYESFNIPGHYSLVSGENIKTIGYKYPKLNNLKVIRMETGNLNIGQLSVPYILTFPQASEGPLPLIVFPHGGPIGVFDSMYFDLGTQFLNQRGFAVLRVNYRGSGGYTQSYMEAGKKQWGSGILEDIHAVTNHIKQRPDIDEGRVCVAGISYGGYAAAMLNMKYPESYQCGVTVAGVSDVFLTISSTVNNKAQFKWAQEYIANLDEDLQAVREISPINLVEQLDSPLLIMHGEADDVVDVEHAYRLKYALEQSGKTYEWHMFKESGHNFEHESDMAEMFDKMVTFINKHI